MCISDYMQTTFFYLGRYLKKLADDYNYNVSNLIYKIIYTISSTWEGGTHITYRSDRDVRTRLQRPFGDRLKFKRVAFSEDKKSKGSVGEDYKKEGLLVKPS